MTTQREYERQIWNALGGHLHASTLDEILGLCTPDLDAMSDAERDRAETAADRVTELCYRKADRR